MTTDVMTLREYADLLDELASEWDGEQPVVLVGDVHGDVSVRADDGFTTYGPVGFAQECFEGTGVSELGMQADTRFFGAMLFAKADLGSEAQEQVDEKDYDPNGGEA
jgi:hypothetical protein